MLFQKYNLELTTDIHACIDHAFVNIRESVSVKRRLQTAEGVEFLTRRCQRSQRTWKMTSGLTALRDGPLKKVMGAGGKFSSRRNFFRYQIPGMNFF